MLAHRRKLTVLSGEATVLGAARYDVIRVLRHPLGRLVPANRAVIVEVLTEKHLPLFVCDCAVLV